MVPSTPSRSSPAAAGAAHSKHGRVKPMSYSDLMKPDEDWRLLPDAAERRKIQNRLAQRAYRRNMRDRTKELEKLKKQLAKLQGKDSAGDISADSEGDDGASGEEQQQQQQHYHHHHHTQHGHLLSHMQSMNGLETSPETDWHDISPSWQPQFDNTHISYFHPALHQPHQQHASYAPPDPSFAPPAPTTPDEHLFTRSQSHSHSGHSRTYSNTSTSSSVLPPGLSLGSPTSSSQTLPSPSISRRPSAPICLDPALMLPTSLPGQTSADVCSIPLWSSSVDVTVAQDGSGSGSEGFWTGRCTPPPSHTHHSNIYPSVSLPSSTSSYLSASNLVTAPVWPDQPPPQPASPPAEDSGSGGTLLHLAVAGGNLPVLHMLLRRCDAGLQVDARDAQGCTALQRAVWAGRMDMVRLLLEAGAEAGSGEGLLIED